MNDIHTSNAIDLIKLMEVVWDGKWQIIAMTAACVVFVFDFQALGPAPKFVATTEIKPILLGDAEKYRQSKPWVFCCLS